MGISEFTWEWPSQTYPKDTLILVKDLVKEEYYSRFILAIWKVPDISDEQLIQAAKKSRAARFEFGESPK